MVRLRFDRFTESRKCFISLQDQQRWAYDFWTLKFFKQKMNYFFNSKNEVIFTIFLLKTFKTTRFIILESKQINYYFLIIWKIFIILFTVQRIYNTLYIIWMTLNDSKEKLISHNLVTQNLFLTWHHINFNEKFSL